MTQQFFSAGLDCLDAPDFAHGPRMSTTRRALQLFTAEWRARLLVWIPTAALASQLPVGFAGWHQLERDQYIEAHTLMSGYLLSSQGDRMSMAASVEGRNPFLDHRVMEFACRLPPRLKLRGLREKLLLKKAMAAELPPSIVARSMQPYRAPDSACFFQRIPVKQAIVQLCKGVPLGGKRTRSATVRLLAEEPVLPERPVPIRFRKSVPTAWLELTIHEGMNRQVRRMTAAVGHPTLRLVRIAIGPVRLADLKPGEWRALTDDEIKGITG